jgi:hypothetical protein
MANDKAPALFEHSLRVYNAMLQESRAVEEAGVHMIVWEGFPTKLIMKQLDMSTPYYTYTLRALQAMNCIKQLRRGGSSTKSQWELICEPTLDAYLEANAKEPTVSEVRFDALEQMARDLTRRLERVEVATGMHRVPVDYISDPTPPGGIKVSGTETGHFNIDHDPGEWVSDDDPDTFNIDHENADKYGAE